MGLTAHRGATRRSSPSAHAPSSWMTRQAPALSDIVRVSDHGVGVPGRQEVEFKDGQRIQLLQVIRMGAPDLFLRELGAPATGTVIDLRKLIPGVEQELPTTSTRDVAGYVFFALRGRFGTLGEFLQAAVAQGAPGA